MYNVFLCCFSCCLLLLFFKFVNFAGIGLFSLKIRMNERTTSQNTGRDQGSGV